MSKIISYEEVIKIINNSDGRYYTMNEKDKAYDEFLENVKLKRLIVSNEEIKKVKYAYKEYYDDGRAWVDLEPNQYYENDDLDDGPIGDCIGYDKDF